VMLPQQHSLNCSDGEHCGYVACLLVESVKEKAFVGKREGIFSFEQLLRLRWSGRWAAHAFPSRTNSKRAGRRAPPDGFCHCTHRGWHIPEPWKARKQLSFKLTLEMVAVRYSLFPLDQLVCAALDLLVHQLDN
jgi:hypothetical protein